MESVKECAAGRLALTHVGGAKPIRPALQPEIRDQRQARNVRGLGDLLEHRPSVGDATGNSASSIRKCAVSPGHGPGPWRMPTSGPASSKRTSAVEVSKSRCTFGMRGGKARQPRDQPAVGERVQRRYPNSGDFLVLIQQRAGYCVEVGQRGVGRVRQRAALCCQRHAARMSLKERYAQCRFESPHVMADGTGGEVQLLGGVREVLMARGRREHCEGRQDGGADRHEPRAIFVTDARSMRLQSRRLQRK